MLASKDSFYGRQYPLALVDPEGDFSMGSHQMSFSHLCAPMDSAGASTRKHAKDAHCCYSIPFQQTQDNPV